MITVATVKIFRERKKRKRGKKGGGRGWIRLLNRKMIKRKKVF